MNTNTKTVIGIGIGIGILAIIGIAASGKNNTNTNSNEKNEIVKTAVLSDTLKLDSYKLVQKSYCVDDYGDCEYSDYYRRYDHVVEGSLVNSGDTIPAWKLHVHFDIYEKNGKKLDGAYCIIWNDVDIPSGSTWNFKASDNLDDCFAGVDAETYFGTESVSKKRIKLDDFDIRYRTYDTNYEPKW